tara:strand:- start:1561 stop:2022 length:462 start_codon:yes stop_codon:yes gene_type:complete
MPIYYLNGTTLSNSTAVYADSELTICESDGYYSNGTIVRQQVNCQLLNIETCAACPDPNPPSETIYVSTVLTDCNSFCPGDAPEYLISLSIVSPKIWAALSLGDSLPLSDGWYATAATSTSTLPGNDVELYNMLNGQISDIRVCAANGQCSSQ